MSPLRRDETPHETGKRKGRPREKTRLPSKALFAQEIRENKTLSLARMVSWLVLHGHAVAEAARLELKECEMTSQNKAVRIMSPM